MIVPAGHNPDGVSSVDLELLPDGRIATSGTTGLDGALGMDVLVVVVDEDGTPDAGFDGHDGTFEVDLGASSQIDSGGLIALRARRDAHGGGHEEHAALRARAPSP